MNHLVVSIMVLLASAAALYADLPQQMRRIFDDSLSAAQQVSTAGDLHSMSVMLDAAYIMNRRLPSEEAFGQWLQDTFKENHVKDLAEDHWGNRYLYKVSKDGRRYVLRSVGPDGVAETDDDMTKSGP